MRELTNNNEAASPRQGEEPLVRFQGVSYSYSSGTTALDGLDLELYAGEFVAVIGANGSGKSTLARHVNALLVPDAGRVTVCGLDSSDPANALAIRRSAAMVFQNPDNQAVASCVEDDVAFGPENLQVPPEEIRRRVDQALSAVGMEGHAKREIHTLSGGQKQRVAIAGALAMHPRVLVLDESTAMLDVAGRKALVDIVKTLASQGMAVMLVTHYMDEAAQASRVVVLDHGSVALQGTPQQVFSQADCLLALGLELPFEAQLERLMSQGPKTPDLQETPSAHASPQASGLVSEKPLISLAGVSFSYGEGPVLQDLSLEVRPGDFLGVIGHTGSGKSTLLQLLNGLLLPTAGEVLVDGASTALRRKLPGIRQKVGVAFQYPEMQLFATSVFEDVAFGPRNLGLAGEEVNQRVNWALEQVGFDAAAIGPCSPFELSGGQQRRVALAGIIAMRPRVLVLDEPMAGMDPQGQRQFRELLRSLAATGMTVVLVSHSMDDVAALCNRVVVLDKGRIVCQGSPQQVFSRKNAPVLHSMGLGLPQAAEHALLLEGHNRPLGLWPLTVEQLAFALLSQF